MVKNNSTWHRPNL